VTSFKDNTRIQCSYTLLGAIPHPLHAFPCRSLLKVRYPRRSSHQCRCSSKIWIQPEMRIRIEKNGTKFLTWWDIKENLYDKMFDTKIIIPDTGDVVGSWLNMSDIVIPSWWGRWPWLERQQRTTRRRCWRPNRRSQRRNRCSTYKVVVIVEWILSRSQFRAFSIFRCLIHQNCNS